MVTTQELVFSRLAATNTGSNPVVELVFGAVDAVEVEDPNGVDPITGIYRGDSTMVSASWQQAQALPKTFDAPWLEAAGLPLQHAIPLQDAAPAHTHFVAPWAMDFESADARLVVAFGNAAPHGGQLEAPWVVLNDLANLGIAAAWGQAMPHSANVLAVWDALLATDRLQALVWKDAKHQAVVMATPWQVLSTESVQLFTAPWQQAVLLTSFGGGVFAIGGAAPVVPDQAVLVPLVFCELYPNQAGDGGGWPSSIDIAFGVSRCTPGASGAEFVILPARVYMTVHNVYAQLLPSMVDVPIYNATLSADVGSFAWNFSANGPESLFNQLARTSALPVQIKLTIDGLEWVFLIETRRKTSSFGKSGVSIAGRSVTALTGAPWVRDASYINNASVTAQQIAASALDLSGVGLDWGITDWLVPAGAWSHTGSRLSAVQRVAEAAGGYLQSHRSLPTLQVRHPYPLLAGGVPGGPWNWGAVGVDIELADEVVITCSKEDRDGPDVDAVYVTGTNQGVVALVKRTGTAGANLGSMQVDSLITHVDAATQRGLSVLGTAGAKEYVTLELPVLTGIGQPGVIDVGKLVQVNELSPWRGRVRSIEVTCSSKGSDEPMTRIRQLATLERHL
jgi:hypothetical protein